MSSFANIEQYTLPEEQPAISATLCNKVGFLLSTLWLPLLDFLYLTSQVSALANCCPLGFASLPTHVIFPKKVMLEEQPHLWLQLATLKGCHIGTSLLPIVGFQNGVRVLCWDVLLGCLSEFFHISLVWMLSWKSLLSEPLLDSVCILEHFLNPFPPRQPRDCLLVLPFRTFGDGALSGPKNGRILKPCRCF